MVTGLVKKLGCPMALTSANPHNTKPTGLHSFLLGWWRHKVDLIILGQSTAPRPASAVVDIVSSPPKILRESYVDCEELAEILGINPC
jgi:tRNA A37 threonylcarbamoyladenosine synthetase subunit TsaC/SUA5/YrdC